MAQDTKMYHMMPLPTKHIQSSCRSKEIKFWKDSFSQIDGDDDGPNVVVTDMVMMVSVAWEERGAKVLP